MKKKTSETIKIEYRTFNSGGKGGQNSNRSMNAVEAIARISDGTVFKAVSSSLKSQAQNKKVALKILVSKVRAGISSQEEDRRRTAGWSEGGKRVRSYHIPDNRVKDHLSGLQQAWTEVQKDLGLMIESHQKTKELG